MPTSPEENALDNMGSVSNTETRKPTSPAPLPDAAVEALLESKVGRLGESLNRLNDKSRAALRDMHRDSSRDDLEAAYPHLLAVFSGRLLGDEAVEAALKAAKDASYDVHRDQLADNPTGQPSQRDVVKAALEAAIREVGG